MNRQQYESLLNNSNVRKMLDLIAQTEGVKWGYNTLFGNQKIDNLSAHPNLKKQFTQTNGKTNYTTAAGRYQFIKPTWDGLVGQLGLKDFSPRSQDIGAIALLAENGALPYVLKGDYRTAVRKSGGTWASLPSSSYAQPKRGWDFVNKQLGKQPIQQSVGSDVWQSPQLTVADLERKYGKGQPYQFNVDANNQLQQQDTPQLTVADLERKYGKGQPYQFNVDANNQLQQSNSFLNQDQISQALPQLSKGA